jgi:hypothetical protein
LKYSVGALIAAFAAAVAFAAPAAADADEFVRTMQIRYAFLSEEQLLSAGAKACNLIGSGAPAADAVIMVRNDLGVSVSAAGEIVSSAVVDLGC